MQRATAISTILSMLNEKKKGQAGGFEYRFEYADQGKRVSGNIRIFYRRVTGGKEYFLIMTYNELLERMTGSNMAKHLESEIK